jgi:hypothetical protein
MGNELDLLEIAGIMNATDAKREKVGLDRLSERERVVTLISHARFEILLGGLSHFYWSTDGHYAIETEWALEQIEALESASVLRRANKLFPEPASTKDEACCKQVVESIEDDLDALGDEFHDASDKENLDRLIYKYIDEHRAELPEPEQ